MLRIQVVNPLAVAQQTAAVGRVIRDSPEVTRVMPLIGQRILTFTRRRFENLSRSGGSGEWPDLAPATKRARLTKTKTQRQRLDRQARQAGVRRRDLLADAIRAAKLPILVDTGTLRNSLSIIRVDRRAVSVGTAIHYAAAHQYGRRHLPIRRIVAPPDRQTLEEINADFARVVRQAIANATRSGRRV